MEKRSVCGTAAVEMRVERMSGKEDVGQRWSAGTERNMARALVARDAVEAIDLEWPISPSPQ